MYSAIEEFMSITSKEKNIRKIKTAQKCQKYPMKNYYVIDMHRRNKKN